MYIFGAFVFLYYSGTLFEAKLSLSKRIALTIVGYAILYCVFLINSTILNFICFLFINTVLLWLSFSIKPLIAVLHSTIMSVSMIVAEYITIIIFTNIFHHNFNEFDKYMITYGLVIFFSKLLYFTLCIISIRIFSKNENIKNQNYLSIIIVPLSNCFIMLVFRYIIYKIEITSTIYYLWIAAVCLLVATSFFVFIIQNRTIRKTQEVAELKIENQKYEAEKKAFELVTTANEEMRRISHDYKNQLTLINNMDDVEEIHHYIEPLLSEIGTVSKIGISKNPTLDLIINKYTMICNNKCISFSVDVKSSNLSYIQDNELTSLMCNLLDNAVEAVEKSAEKKISLRIVAKNQLQDILIISNSCDEAPKQKSGKLLTSKPDKQFHGIGSKSIMRVVKKYNGIYDWEYGDENKIFETTIIFPKQNIIDAQLS